MLRRASAASALTSDPLPRRSITTTAATSAFHEPNLTDSWFKDRLPLTALGRPAPAPLPKGARGPLPLSRFAGEGWGEGEARLWHLGVFHRSLLNVYFPIVSGSWYVGSIGSADTGSHRTPLVIRLHRVSPLR